MRLWQAMLVGAQRGPQVFGTWGDGHGGTCAMGAVMCGIGCEIDDVWNFNPFTQVRETFPELKLFADCPDGQDCGNDTHLQPLTLMEVIMHLNDRHKWSRQRIAEWLSGDSVSAPKNVRQEATV